MKKILVVFLVLSLLSTQLTGCCPQVLDLIKKPKNPPPKLKQVKIDTLGVLETEKGYEGKTSKVVIKAEENKTNEVRVGFYEEEVAGSGPMWRSAGWMAAIISSFLLARNLSDYRFTFDVSGYIDGPSAGGFMTSGVLACLLGDKIKKNVTMTGTINPDGTIGPVGGIPQKIEAAKKAKKKLVLIPAGQRYDYDLNEEETIDVIEFGEEKGIEVKEVGDVYEAYKLLTGKTIPKPEGVSAKKPELPKGIYTKMKSQAKEWYSRYLEERGKYDAINAVYKDDTGNTLAQSADEYAQKAEDYLDDGLMASAYNQAGIAAFYASLAYQWGKINELYWTGGIEAAANNLDSILSSAQVKVSGLLDDLKTEKPKTLADVVAIADAYGIMADATGIEVKTSEVIDSLSEPGQTEQQIWESLWLATAYSSWLNHMPRAAEDSLDVGMNVGKAETPDKKQVKQLSEALRKAAESNLNYFDEVVLADIAKSRGVDMDSVKAAFMGYDWDYLFATVSVVSLDKVKKKAGTNKDVAVLGNSLESYNLSSGLIAKYYSLDTKVDDVGTVVEIGNEKALINMLDLAEAKAEENLNLARKVGAEPVIGIYYYESAKVEREGKPEDKLEALRDFWRASTQGRILAIMGGVEIAR